MTVRECELIAADDRRYRDVGERLAVSEHTNDEIDFASACRAAAEVGAALARGG